MPQILHNVKYQGENNPLDNIKVQDAIKASESRLKGEGRVLVRKSGTEKLIRIMIEGKDQNLIKEIAEEIAKEII